MGGEHQGLTVPIPAQYELPAGLSDPRDPRLIWAVAVDMYERYAEPLARTVGAAGALSFFNLMSSEIQNFWYTLAKTAIDHSRHWRPNSGSSCVLGWEETKRLKELPDIIEAARKEYLGPGLARIFANTPHRKRR